MDETDKANNIKTQLLHIGLLQDCANIREASLKWAMQEFLLKQSPELYPEYPEFVKSSMSSLLSGGVAEPSSQFFSFLYNLLLASAAAAGAHLQLDEGDIERGWLEYHSQGFEGALWESDFQLFKTTFLVAPFSGARGDITMFDYLKWSHQFNMFYGEDQTKLAGQEVANLIDSDDDEDSDEDPDYRPELSLPLGAFGADGSSRLLRNNPNASFEELPEALRLSQLDEEEEPDDDEDEDDDDDPSGVATPESRIVPNTQSTGVMLRAIDKAVELQKTSVSALMDEKKNLQRDLLAARLLANSYKHRSKQNSKKLKDCRQKISSYERDIKRWTTAIQGTNSNNYFKSDQLAEGGNCENTVPESDNDGCKGSGDVELPCFPEQPGFLNQEEMNRIVSLAIYKWVKVPGRRRIYNKAFQMRVISLLKTYRVSNIDAPLFLLRTWALWCGFLGELPQDLTISSRTLEGRNGWVAECESMDAVPIWNTQFEEYTCKYFKETQFNWSWQGRNVAATTETKPVQRRQQRKSLIPKRGLRDVSNVNVGKRAKATAISSFNLKSFNFL